LVRILELIELNNGGYSMTIRLRITLLCAGVLSASLLLFGLCLYFFLRAYIFDDFKNSLKAQTNQVKQNLQYILELNPRGWDFSIQLGRFDTVRTGMYLQIYNIPSGTKTKTENLRDVDLPVKLDTLKDIKESYYFITNVGSVPFIIYNDPLILNGNIVGVLQSAYNISVINMFFSILRIVLIVLSLFVILISSLLGWILSKNALKPVYSLISATEQIQNSDDLKNRINESRSDEIGLLSKTINAMLQRIQTIYEELNKLYTAQRRFVSDASHELRTPLTTINGNAQFLKKIWSQYLKESEREADLEEIKISLEALNDITDEGNRMARLVNDLLTLARADIGVQLTNKLIEIKPVVDSVIRKTHQMNKTVELRVGNLEILENVQVVGDTDYLQQLFFIFLENAFKFTLEGYIEVNASLIEDNVSIIIRDTGIGMDDNETPHIFERFYRADSSRGQTKGTGLGLSIAKWILDEHKATVEIISEKGKGTTFVIRFPIYSQLIITSTVTPTD
jgi:two-component system OmpR family sensor kinase